MRISRFIVLAATAFALPATAEEDCAPVSGTVVTTFVTEGCTSPVGVCTTGTVDAGALSGTSAFTATSEEVTGAVIQFAGVFTVETERGTAAFNTSGSLNLVTGGFVERFTLISGPFGLAMLASTGSVTATGFSGTLLGVTCSD